MRFDTNTHYKVRQPQFGNWVYALQQKKGIKNSGYFNKVDGKLSASTIKDVHKGIREVFTGRTLNIIAVEFKIP
ncbi:MAG: hypothetical protein AAFP70_07625 [Calditrichota bacterium]